MGRGGVREEFSSIHRKMRKETKEEEEEGKEKGQEITDKKKKSEGLGDKNLQRVNLTFTHLYAIIICQSGCVKDGSRSWRHISESNIPFWC